MAACMGGAMPQSCPALYPCRGCTIIHAEGKAQLCPVCGGSGTFDWGIGHDGTAVTTSNRKTCHGCGGKGWVAV